jgi:hypothetical protein
MSWTQVNRERKPGWNRKDGYELRLTSKTIGYLNANAREFLFDGKRAGMIAFEEDDGSGTMSIVATTKGLKVNAHGHLAISTVTNQTSAPLPVTVLLNPVDGEHRLLFGGVRK